MAESKPRVLLVEDTRSLAVVYEQYLAQDGYEVQLADCGQQALAQLLASPPPVVLLDLELPDMSGMDILQQITERQLPCSVVVITAHGSVDVAVEAMRCGAFDFLTKPFDGKRLCATARNALKHQQLSSLVAQYRENFERSSFAGFIGASMAMQAVYRIIESAAPSKATVFITGESGTGKEVCAEAIHQCSPRRDQPFIALNCAAIPHDLMESEIFGHVKGSFTGAQGDRKGAASLADGGTLFLDEICEMDLDLQSKLLRFIQTGTLQRVGSGKGNRPFSDPDAAHHQRRFAGFPLFGGEIFTADQRRQPHPQRRHGDADGGEQLKRRLARTFAAQAAMAFEHFADLPPDGRHGIEAGRRLLEDHRHAAAAHRAHLGFRQLHEVGAGEAHLAAENAPRRRQQAQERQRRGRLAAARLAEQRQRFPGTQIEIHAIDRRQHPPPGQKTSTQVTNGKQRHVIHPSRAIARTA
mgnify:CR=1 FL=1